MASKEQLFSTERNWRNLSGVLAVTGVLALAGCGGNNESSPESSTPTTQTPAPSETQSSPSSAPNDTESPMLVFDDLGASPPIIQVYPGVSENAADKEANGTYNDGDSVVAECKTEGRTVNSNPSIGEEDRTSNEWIRIQGTPDETQYATAVYIENPQALIRQLSEC